MTVLEWGDRFRLWDQYCRVSRPRVRTGPGWRTRPAENWMITDWLMVSLERSQSTRREETRIQRWGLLRRNPRDWGLLLMWVDQCIDSMVTIKGEISLTNQSSLLSHNWPISGWRGCWSPHWWWWRRWRGSETGSSMTSVVTVERTTTFLSWVTWDLLRTTTRDWRCWRRCMLTLSSVCQVSQLWTEIFLAKNYDLWQIYFLLSRVKYFSAIFKWNIFVI